MSLYASVFDVGKESNGPWQLRWKIGMQVRGSGSVGAAFLFHWKQTVDDSVRHTSWYTPYCGYCWRPSCADTYEPTMESGIKVQPDLSREKPHPPCHRISSPGSSRRGIRPGASLSCLSRGYLWSAGDWLLQAEGSWGKECPGNSWFQCLSRALEKPWWLVLSPGE